VVCSARARAASINLSSALRVIFFMLEALFKIVYTSLVYAIS
jgi:hypothetical protein